MKVGGEKAEASRGARPYPLVGDVAVRGGAPGPAGTRPGRRSSEEDDPGGVGWAGWWPSCQLVEVQRDRGSSLSLLCFSFSFSLISREE